jgi:hypothetical protein
MGPCGRNAARVTRVHSLEDFQHLVVQWRISPRGFGRISIFFIQFSNTWIFIFLQISLNFVPIDLMVLWFSRDLVRGIKTALCRAILRNTMKNCEVCLYNYGNRPHSLKHQIFARVKLRYIVPVVGKESSKTMDSGPRRVCTHHLSSAVRDEFLPGLFLGPLKALSLLPYTLQP